MPEPTHFEMYLLVILPFDSALLGGGGGGGTPLYRLYRYVQLKGYEKYGVDLGNFRLKLGMFFFHSSLELGKF